jgi:O-antigen/teichoic acid export membrane protein
MRLRQNMLWMLCGNGTFAAFQWLYLICTAHIYGPEAAGYYALALAIIYPAFALLNLQLRRLQVTDRESQIPYAAYAFYAAVSGVVAFLAALAIFFAMESPGIELCLIFVALGSAKFVEYMSETCYGHLQYSELMMPIARSLFMRNSCGFALFFGMALFGLPLSYAVFAIPSAWAVVYFLHDLKQVKSVDRWPRLSKDLSGHLKTIIRTGLPLGGLIFLNQLYITAPRVLLVELSSVTALGYFAPIASLITLGSLFIGSANGAALPRLSRFHANGDIRSFVLLAVKLCLLTVAVGSGAIALAWFAGDLIVAAIFDKPHPDAQKTLLVTMVAGAFWYLGGATGTVLTASRSFGAQLQTSVVLLIVVSGFGIALIPVYGMLGAAYALVAGAATKFLLQLGVIVVRHARTAS